MSSVKVNTAGLDKLKAKAIDLSKAHVKVGVLASKGGNADHDGIAMIELAAIHEYGSPAANIPERSFIRSAFAKKTELNAFVTKLAKAIVDGKLDARRALHMLGTWAAAKVKKNITERDIPPPLKPKTIARKKSTKPLVDTGRLLNAITYEVSEE